MGDWFAVERIDGDTFAISEYGHWEEPHCYLLCGNRSAVLIDTGLGVSDIRKVVDRLTSLPVLVATTHAHWDHIGGHGSFARIAVHAAEQGWLSGSFPLPLQVVKDNLLRAPCDFPADFRPEDYRIYQGAPQIILRDGDNLDLGGRRLVVVHTPGHSPGHCCFHEPERGYLYAGDLIYAGCLDAFYPTTDPQLFWQSVRRIQSLPVRRILPGHHALHIPVSLIGRIEGGFRQLDRAGKLRHGCGIFDFGNFQIHV